MHGPAAAATGAPPAEAGGILTVDLDAVAANWRRCAAQAPGAECAAVVKADAYGTGADRVAPALWRAGCRTFFTAQLREAVALRALLPEAMLYVLNGLLPGTEAFYAAHGLRPVLGSAAEVAAWRDAAGPEAPPAAIHVDTGLNRLGFEVADAVALGRSGPGFPVALVMSHFACAEWPDHALTRRQVEAFSAVRAAFPGVAGSLANSFGLFLGDAARHDVVRPGYALYGGNPRPGGANPMRPVVTLQARIVQTGVAEDGETVGYNAAWTAPRRTRLAVIGIGYADGFPRGAAGQDGRPGGTVLVRGVACPIVGRLSMDLTTVDVTAVAGEPARGELATLIGEGLDLDAVSAASGTIGWQVLTALGRRHHRVYVGG